MDARVRWLALLVSKVADLELVGLRPVVDVSAIDCVVCVGLWQVLVRGALVVYAVDAKELTFSVDRLFARDGYSGSSHNATYEKAFVAVVVL